MARIFKVHRAQAPADGPNRVGAKAVEAPEPGAESSGKPGAPGPRPEPRPELKPGAKAGSRAASEAAKPDNIAKPKEIGGPEGPEPTRYGDWERKGICVDF